MDLSKMNKAYAIRITEPMQIPAVGHEIRIRGADRALFVLLEHDEGPCIVRGGGERLKGLDREVKRGDGGDTWYHSSGSRCLNFSLPYQASETYPSDVEGLLKEWGQTTIGFLESGGYAKPGGLYQCRDVYSINGEKLGSKVVGLSGKITPSEGTRIHRACWYEADPMEEITPLLVSDGFDPREFRAKLEIVNTGFFEYLIRGLSATEIAVEDFVSRKSWNMADEINKKKSGSEPKCCVLERRQETI